MSEEILTVYVKIDECVTVEGRVQTIVLVNFSGYAKSKYFSGKILHGAVDTQAYFKGGSGSLSARYVLEGKDFKGNKCSIFIENNGNTDSPYTTPKITADSAELAWLEESELRGTIESVDDAQIIIHIFKH